MLTSTEPVLWIIIIFETILILSGYFLCHKRTIWKIRHMFSHLPFCIAVANRKGKILFLQDSENLLEE